MFLISFFHRTLYWTDWNREAPKIESSSVDGHNRRVLVQDGIGLPNALTYDSTTRQVCWADAGVCFAQNPDYELPVFWGPFTIRLVF